LAARPRAFHFDRSWSFAVPPEELWSAVSRTDAFPHWWSWLRHFDAPGLHTGARATCVIQAPLPYALHLAIDIEWADPPHRVDTIVRGDLAGPARLEIAPHGDGGSSARLVFDLAVHNRVLRPLAGLARPALEWAHDRVVDTGVEQFRRCAFAVS
jgi:uncharacterized protein YndB with AHSA1/START domain